MPMIKTITKTVENAYNAYLQERRRAEEERLSEMQFAREMRNRSEFGTTNYYYYNAIVKRCGGF